MGIKITLSDCTGRFLRVIWEKIKKESKKKKQREELIVTVFLRQNTEKVDGPSLSVRKYFLIDAVHIFLSLSFIINI